MIRFNIFLRDSVSFVREKVISKLFVRIPKSQVYVYSLFVFSGAEGSFFNFLNRFFLVKEGSDKFLRDFDLFFNSKIILDLKVKNKLLDKCLTKTSFYFPFRLKFLDKVEFFEQMYLTEYRLMVRGVKVNRDSLVNDFISNDIKKSVMKPTSLYRRLALHMRLKAENTTLTEQQEKYNEMYSLWLSGTINRNPPILWQHFCYGTDFPLLEVRQIFLTERYFDEATLYNYTIFKRTFRLRRKKKKNSSV